MSERKRSPKPKVISLSDYRALPPGPEPEPQEDKVTETYRGAMALQKQKMGRTPKEEKELRGQSDWIEELEPGSPAARRLDVIGFEGLSLGAWKAVEGLELLLERTDGGHERITGKLDPVTRKPIEIPVLKFSKSEWYELYGLQRGQNNKIPGGKRQEALAALADLADSRIFNFDYHEKGERARLTCKEPLITYRYLTLGLTDQEKRAIDIGGKQNTSRESHYVVTLGPLWVTNLESFNVIKDRGWIQEIEDYRRAFGGRARTMDTAFVTFLLQKDFNPVSIGAELLAYRIGLKKLIQNRQWRRINRGIREVLTMGKALGYLSSYEKTTDAQGQDKYTLKLRPARCKRLKSKAGREIGGRRPKRGGGRKGNSGKRKK